jgi:alpha-glucoside transport system permease protein
MFSSFMNSSGKEFVGLSNYLWIFTQSDGITAVINTIIWVLLVPTVSTIVGLAYAVFIDRTRGEKIYKVLVFMPMAISMLAAGVIFRGLFQENPNLGAVNAAIVGVQGWFGDAANYPGAGPREGTGIVADRGIISSEETVQPGSIQNFALTGVRQGDLPEEAEDAQAVDSAADTEISGTVFLDVIRGGGGTNGEIEEGKSGLPGIRVDAVAPDGSIAGYATTGAGGEYTIEGLTAGESYTVALPAANFDEGGQGVSWLSASFINAVVILSYIWIWAGFAMVMIASGLSAMDRSLQEAARMDGASEWKVFTKITVPLLAPVLIVVIVTLIINVLKIFDLVYVIPPGASKPAANVIAVEMWTQSFGGGNNQGLGSALAILLLILVLPSMIMNVRRFRQEKAR